MANDKKVEPKPSKPSVAGKPEVLTPGTSAEEQKKSAARTLYPKRKGLRGVDIDGDNDGY